MEGGSLTLCSVEFELLERPTSEDASLSYGGGVDAAKPGQQTSQWAPYVVDRQITYRVGLPQGERRLAYGGASGSNRVRMWMNPEHHLTMTMHATSRKGAKSAAVTTREYSTVLRGRNVSAVLAYAPGEHVDLGPDDDSNPDLRYRIRAHNLRVVEPA
jgi:hypothetical protein